MTWARACGVLLAAACVAALVLPPRTADAEPQSSRAPADRATAPNTAAIVGVVQSTDAVPQPVRRALVRVTGAGPAGERRTTTDADGRFIVENLSAGRYSVSAERPGFVTTSYGARRPGGQGTSIMVPERGRVSLVVPLARGAVITGTVYDQSGQPAADVRVRPLAVRTGVSGARRFVSLASTDVTDSRGTYRIYGLPSGEYVVEASRRTIGALEMPDTSATPISDARPPTGTFTGAFHPNARSAADGSVVTVAPGEERQGIDVRMGVEMSGRVTVRVTTPDGAPVRDAIVGQFTNSTPGTFSGSSQRSIGPDGTATFTSGPGSYTVSARGTTTLADGGTVAGWARSEVILGDAGQVDITLMLEPGTTISGRVVVASSAARGAAVSAPAPDVSGTSVGLVPDPPAFMGGLGEVDAAGRFSIDGVAPGRYMLTYRPLPPGGTWTVASATVGGRDAFDASVEIGRGPVGEAIVTLTDRTQEVSGTLSTTDGAPASEYTVVVVPADRTLWSAGRRMATTRPDSEGRFVIRTLPAGDYRIAALTDVTPTDLEDAAFLTLLVETSQPLTLAPGDRLVRDFRIAGPPR